MTPEQKITSLYARIRAASREHSGYALSYAKVDAEQFQAELLLTIVRLLERIAEASAREEAKR